MKSLFAALCVVVCLSQGAWAGVVYNWENITPTDNGHTFYGTVVFTNEAWLSGGASIYYTDYDSSPCDFSMNGFEEVSFGGNGQIQFTSERALTDTGDACAIDPEYPSSVTIFEVGLNRHGQGLVGSMGFYMGYSDEIYLEGGDTWSVTDIGSDNFDAYGGCAYTHSCFGATGRWVLDRQSLRGIPEPSTIFLYGFGMIGLWKVASKRRKGPNTP